LFALAQALEVRAEDELVAKVEFDSMEY